MIRIRDESSSPFRTTRLEISRRECVSPFISNGKDRRNIDRATSGKRDDERGKRAIASRTNHEPRRGGEWQTVQSVLFFVLVDVDNFSCLIHFDRDLSTGGNIPEHAALGFEFEILLSPGR